MRKDVKGAGCFKEEHVAKVIEHMRDLWVPTAKAWWAHRKLTDPSLKRWDKAMALLMFETPTMLDLESLLCEQGNRQRNANAYAARINKIDGVSWADHGTKKRWQPTGERKNLTKVVLPHRGADSKVVLKIANLMA